MAKRKPKAPARRTFGSPIEIMLRNGIVQAATSQKVTIYDHSVFDGTPALVRGNGNGWEIVNQPESEGWGVGDDMWSLYGGVVVGSYRVDFLLETTYGVVAIECDGHDWHDRTKQQAAYDRSRDRELLISGVPTIRFTGSEIHHSIDRCVSDVYAVARSNDEIHGRPIDAWQGGYSHARSDFAEQLNLADRRRAESEAAQVPVVAPREPKLSQAEVASFFGNLADELD